MTFVGVKVADLGREHLGSNFRYWNEEGGRGFAGQIVSIGPSKGPVDRKERLVTVSSAWGEYIHVDTIVEVEAPAPSPEYVMNVAADAAPTLDALLEQVNRHFTPKSSQGAETENSGEQIVGSASLLTRRPGDLTLADAAKLQQKVKEYRHLLEVKGRELRVALQSAHDWQDTAKSFHEDQRNAIRGVLLLLAGRDEYRRSKHVRKVVQDAAKFYEVEL